MAARSTAPDGYNSNFAAILELLRFGFGMWGPARMAVLLFHVERSTAYGWRSDQHAKSQAENGVYSKQRREWIRGPAGVGHGTWHRENAALIKAGLIHKERRRTSRNGYAASEYEPDWMKIRAAIEDWKETATTPDQRPLFEQPGPLKVEGGLSQPGTRACPTVGQGLSQPGTRACPTVGQTVVSSCSSSIVSESRARDPIADVDQEAEPLTHPQEQAAEIRAAIEAAYGRPLKTADTIPGEVLAIAGRLDIPAEAVCRWVHELAADKRAAHYKITSPRLWATAAGTDLIPWARQNGEYIHQCQVREARAAYAAAEILEFRKAAEQEQTNEQQAKPETGDTDRTQARRRVN